jgi:hypothetical protein
MINLLFHSPELSLYQHHDALPSHLLSNTHSHHLSLFDHQILPREVDPVAPQKIDQLVILTSEGFILFLLFFQLHLQLTRQLCPLIHLLRILQT